MATHVIICFYGSYLSFSVLNSEVRRRKILTTQFYDSVTRQPIKVSALMTLAFIVKEYLFASTILVMCSLMAIMLSLYLMFHISLIRRGMTTNEWSKWSAWGPEVWNSDKNIYQPGFRENLAEIFS